MSTPIIEQAIEILQKTNDGNDLSPEHLSLLQRIVNGWPSESDEVEFAKLYKLVQDGYEKPWFHGIKHLSIDHEGYVYWKGQHVEHYTLSWSHSDEAKESAIDLERRCKILESRGEKVSVISAIWKWED